MSRTVFLIALISALGIAACGGEGEPFPTTALLGAKAEENAFCVDEPSMCKPDLDATLRIFVDGTGDGDPYVSFWAFFCNEAPELMLFTESLSTDAYLYTSIAPTDTPRWDSNQRQWVLPNSEPVVRAVPSVNAGSGCPGLGVAQHMPIGTYTAAVVVDPKMKNPRDLSKDNNVAIVTFEVRGGDKNTWTSETETD